MLLSRQDLLQHPKKAERMGQAGRKRVEEHFSLQQQAERYLSLFEETEKRVRDAITAKD